MALTANPTRTLTIEKNWLRDINRRWRVFTQRVVERLHAQNDVALVINADPFVLSPTQQRTFMAYLQQQIDLLLLGSPSPPNWQAEYQLLAYERGLEQTRASLLSQGAQLLPTPEEAFAGLQLRPFTATPSLSAGGTPTTPIHADALEFLFTRSYTSLKGHTDTMARQVQGVLFDGVQQGKGIDVITRELVDRVGVSRSSAQRIARTETIQAYQRASTNEVARASVELGEEIKLRWLTSRDGRVRHLHATWHGTLATPEQNAKRINESPWNCRCGQAPVIRESDTRAKRDKFARERMQLLAVGNA